MQPKQDRAIKTKQKILNTAQNLFAEFGPNGVSVDKIAEVAGVNKQRIYAYFKSKTKLFEATLIDLFKKINEKDNVLQKLTENDIPNMTEIILSHYLQIHQENPIFWRLIAFANLENNFDYTILNNIKAKCFEHLRDLYAQGQIEGIFKKDVSFDCYIFNLIAVSYIYFSNRQTLQNTIGKELFDKKNVSEKLISETISLLK